MVETHSQDAIPPPVQPLPLTFGFATAERGGECFMLADMSADQLFTYFPETWARLTAAAAAERQKQDREKYMAPLLAELLAEVDDEPTRRGVDQVVRKTQLAERSAMIASFYTKGEK